MMVFIQHSGNSNFRYATGVEVENSYHIFSIETSNISKTSKVGEKLNVLLVPDMEGERAKSESNIRNVLTYSDIGYNRSKSIEECIVSILKEWGVSEIVVPEDFPTKLSLFFKKKIPLKVMKSPFLEKRAVKSEEEVRMIRASCHAAVDAFMFSLRLIEKSLIAGVKRKCEEVRKLVELRLFSRGFLAEKTIIASGVKTCQPHWIGYGDIEGHLVADIFPKNRESGYFGDFTRTVLIPELGKQDKIWEMLDACIEAKNRAEKLVKPGVLAKDIHYEVCDVLESYGYGTQRKNSKEGFIHSTGHGVGLDIHEEPSISENENEIKRGMVFTVEPGLYYKECGGVRVEDTLVVRSNSAEILTPCEDLIILR